MFDAQKSPRTGLSDDPFQPDDTAYRTSVPLELEVWTPYLRRHLLRHLWEEWGGYGLVYAGQVGLPFHLVLSLSDAPRLTEQGFHW